MIERYREAYIERWGEGMGGGLLYVCKMTYNNVYGCLEESIFFKCGQVPPPPDLNNFHYSMPRRKYKPRGELAIFVPYYHYQGQVLLRTMVQQKLFWKEWPPCYLSSYQSQSSKNIVHVLLFCNEVSTISQTKKDFTLQFLTVI